MDQAGPSLGWMVPYPIVLQAPVHHGIWANLIPDPVNRWTDNTKNVTFQNGKVIAEIQAGCAIHNSIHRNNNNA